MDLFVRFEQLLSSVLLPVKRIDSKNELDFLLVESIIRSYLTHLRSIYSFPHVHSSISSSLIDLFLLLEYQSLEQFEQNLSNQMEHLLEIFSGLAYSNSDSQAFIPKILYESDLNIEKFVKNYGRTLEHLRRATAKNVNLRFIRRRKQFLQIMRLEQIRQQTTDDLAFHVSSFLFD